MIFERGHFKSDRIQKSSITESLRETRMFTKAKYDPKPTVFISHKHSDLEDIEELQGVIELLEEMGSKIYIDSMDNKMPEQTSGDTALRIKDVIKYCKKFILIATERAIESYWCNWELGIGDTHKYIEHIAILPIKERQENDAHYKGNEYLQIYPRINYFKSFRNIDGQYFKEGYYVQRPKNKLGRVPITELSEWLNT